MDNILTTNKLSKKFKSNLAVDGICMNINRGDIYGFVGENGSGKTTVIRLISGLIFPSSGSFKLFGADNNSGEILSARSKIGAIVETPSIYLNMSAFDNLKSQCLLLKKGEECIPEVLKDVGLYDLITSKKHAGDFSLGMRQRLGIAMALLAEPEFLILDEPMNGLDPAGIVEIRELILRLNKEKGITFLISSHILSELSLVATKYGIISKGKIIKEITAEELHKECAKTTYIYVQNSEILKETLESINLENPFELIESGVRIFGEIDLNVVLLSLIQKDIKISSINCCETGFEEYYLSLLGGAHNG